MSMGLPIGIKKTLSLRSKGVFYTIRVNPLSEEPIIPTDNKGGGKQLLVERKTTTQTQ